MLAVAGLALASCSEEKKAAAPKPEAPRGHFTISPPPMPTDPTALKEAQRAMVAAMIADPNIPLDVIEGEAFRRKVTLTDEQIARKKAQKPTMPVAPVPQPR